MTRKVGVPFRWNVGDRALKRRIPRGRTPRFPDELVEHLIRAVADAVRAADDADLVFVGRSPESLYDLLSGAFETTSWRERVQLLQVSLRVRSIARLREHFPTHVQALRRYLEHLRLAPPQILARERPIAFVDLVFHGETFRNLLDLVRTEGTAEQWAAIRERIRWVCLVARDWTGKGPWAPNEAAWTSEVPATSIRCIPLPDDLWYYLANEQPKTTDSHEFPSWGAPESGRPPVFRVRAAAARTAHSLFRLGETSRARLAVELGRPPAPAPWIATLIRELRSTR